jgi:hypothetical protein
VELGAEYLRLLHRTTRECDDTANQTAKHQIEFRTGISHTRLPDCGDKFQHPVTIVHQDHGGKFLRFDFRRSRSLCRSTHEQIDSPSQHRRSSWCPKGKQSVLLQNPKIFLWWHFNPRFSLLHLISFK